MKSKKIGVLIVNLGTPSAPTPKAVRRFLLEFLSDPRVIDLPKLPWQLLLRFVILPLRCKKVANNYQKIWTEQGSPLMVICQSLLKQLQIQHPEITFELGMTYGEQNIKQGLLALKQKGIDKLLILPLYPQYSSTTTASVFDAVTKALRHCPNIPEIRFIKDYHEDSLYIDALVKQVRGNVDLNDEKQHLVISFHGLPERYCENGDPYREQCEKTAQLLVASMGLDKSQYSVCFQSRFGKAKWLEPSTENTVKALVNEGKKHIAVLCPGFSTDCLETLEEIALSIKQLFLANGGETFMYIPALNDCDNQVSLLDTLVKNHIHGW